MQKDALRRLVISFLLAAQKSQGKAGLIQQDQALAGLMIGKSKAQIDAIEITEDVLGFDSLGTLDLITELNRFFGLSTSGVEDYLLVKRRIGDWVDLIAHHGDCIGDAWRFGFQTSGSTGAPKLIPHGAQALWREMQAQAAGPFAHIKPPGRILSLVPPQHIYGFMFSCVLPAILNVEVVDLHMSAPGAAFRHARPGDLIVGTPFNWALLGKTGLQFCDSVSGVTSAGPSDARTWDVIAKNNLMQLTEVYGATETAGIAVRTAPDTPFTLLPHLKADGARILLCHDNSALDVQDDLTWISQTQFTIQGRRDSVVQVGGVNVSTQLVSDQLKQIDGVTDAAVRLGAERLRAFIVPASGVEVTSLESRIQAHVMANLAAPARPASYAFGAELPRNAMGKIADWG